MQGGTLAPLAAGRKGRYWSDDVTVNNNANPAAPNPWRGAVTIFTAKRGTGGSPDVYRADSRMAEIGARMQSFTYDLDGNLTSDGIVDYQWDAENRLIRMETNLTARSWGFPHRLLEFRYDYLGRRVQKRVIDVTQNQEILSRRYLYDGWNLVAEYAAPGGSTCGVLLRSYTWGLDIVNTVAKAGGVGALLQIADHPSGQTYLPTYDGNGNIAALVNASTSARAAAYEYSPYGEPLRAQTLDPVVADNPFRFSTKFTDLETGLVYYGHRFYDPKNGRFINRDPIEEAGGINLYGFCWNDPVNLWDVLGMLPAWYNTIIVMEPFEVRESRYGGGGYSSSDFSGSSGSSSASGGEGGGGGGGGQTSTAVGGGEEVTTSGETTVNASAPSGGAPTGVAQVAGGDSTTTAEPIATTGSTTVTTTTGNAASVATTTGTTTSVSTPEIAQATGAITAATGTTNTSPTVATATSNPATSSSTATAATQATAPNSGGPTAGGGNGIGSDGSIPGARGGEANASTPNVTMNGVTLPNQNANNAPSGKLTLGQANGQYLNGSGVPVMVDAQQYDFSKVNPNGFNSAGTQTYTFPNKTSSDFLVNGTVTLQLGSGGQSFRVLPDTYDFDMHSWTAQPFRNLATLGANVIANPTGSSSAQPFQIIFRGNLPLPPPKGGG